MSKAESSNTGLLETTTLESETGSKTQLTGASNVVVQQSPGSSVELNQNDDKYLIPSNKETRLVVIGRTGEGKSSTCNSILGEKRFKPMTGFRSGSKVTQYIKKEIDGHELSIVDTPGICDTDNGQQETLLEIMKCLLMSSPGPHAFLLVIAVQRYTKEAREAVAILRKYFGANSLSNTIIVFTRKDELDDDDTTVTEVLDQAPEDLHCLIEECGGRYVWFNNKANEEENKRQVSCLLQMVTDLKRMGFFSSEIYDKVEAELKKELYRKASKVLKARTEELKQLQEIIGKQKKRIEILNNNPMTPKDEAELKRLTLKVDANIRLFDERKIAMDTFIIELRENMRMRISQLGAEIAISAAISGSLGALTGFGVGAVIGAPIGAILAGLSYGLVTYFKQRRTEGLIEQLNTEVSEVMQGTYLKQHESKTETQK